MSSRYHPRRRRRRLGAKLLGGIVVLSCGAPQLIAEVLKVVPAHLELQHFLDHWHEISQRADRAQRSRLGGPDQSSRRGQNERVFERFERHAAFPQLSRQHTVRAAHEARSARRGKVGIQQPPDILVLFHERSSALRLAQRRAADSDSSALARNDPTLLTEPDPGNPPAAGMISLSLPSTCGRRAGFVRWVTLFEQKWVILAERRGACHSSTRS